MFNVGEGRISYMAHDGSGNGRFYATTQRGRVLLIENGIVQPDPFLDISDIVDSSGSEQGLLSIAFDPNYASNGQFYVNYTAIEGFSDTVVSRFTVSDNPKIANRSSLQEVIRIDQIAANHNGGQLQFGRDGFLYIGMGDGGHAGDPEEQGENLNTLLGKMLRIIVSGQETYAVPSTNPFANGGGSPEIWAYGLRNPWRFSFDRLTGDLYIGDVGQGKREEINFQANGAGGGQNYGWNTMEGSICFDPTANCDTSGRVFPVAEYAHDQGCSVTGGYVYRGFSHPSLQGTYFFADFCFGTIWGLKQINGVWQQEVVMDTELNISSFAEGPAGELFVIDHNGGIFKIVGQN